MLRKLIGATLLALPLPAVAQDGTAQDGAARVLDMLVTACDSPPNASITPVETPDAMVGTSADGKVVVSTRGMRDEQAQMISLIVNTAELPGGRMVSCALSVIQPQDGAFAGMPELVASRAGEILGAEPVSVGGPVAPHQGARVQYWTTPDFPPTAELSLTIGPPVITMKLSRYRPGN